MISNPGVTKSHNSSPLIAIAVPCFNEGGLIAKTSSVLLGMLVSLIDLGVISKHSFIFFIDDGSTDSTWGELSELHFSDTRIKGAKLSRNFGHQAALFAAYSYLAEKCDAVISIDADLQQDVNAIPEFVEKYRAGFDVVLGVRRDRKSDGLMKKISAQLFYRLMLIFGVELIPNHADYRLLSNRALLALTQHKESGLFLRALCLQLGFPRSIVSFDVKQRFEGESKYTLRKMMRLCLDGITSFSVTPLRLVFGIGFLIFLVSIAMSAYVIFIYLFGRGVVPGWASTILPIYLIGGVQLLCLGVIGEYIGKLFIAVQNRPRWIFDTFLD